MGPDGNMGNDLNLPSEGRGVAQWSVISGFEALEIRRRVAASRPTPAARVLSLLLPQISSATVYYQQCQE